MRVVMPSCVHWEVTYACPLRCVHCYSDSGRRASRQLPADDLVTIAKILVEMRRDGLQSVAFSGGEPLVVRELPKLARQLLDGGLRVDLNTSGQGLTADLAEQLIDLTTIRISIDSPIQAVNDHIRGRSGAFSAALEALEILDETSRQASKRGEPGAQFGIDMVVMRSTFDSMRTMITDVASRFDMLRFISFGAVIPIGLASHESFGSELLTDEQLRLLTDPGFLLDLCGHAKRPVDIDCSNNSDFRIYPSPTSLSVMTIEPDGAIRGLTAYEGTVGNILTDEPEQLWHAACELRRHHVVTDQLATVKSAADWARAARNIDQAFASPEALVRIGRRKPYTAPPQ